MSSKFGQFYNELNGKYQELTNAPLISDLITVLLVLAASVVFKTAFPGLSTELLAIFSLLALIVFLIFLRHNKSWGLAGTMALLIIGILSLIFGQKAAPRGGAYIIFDYSTNMQGVLRGTKVGSLISVAAAQVPDNTDVGLMMSGDPIVGDENECYRAKQIQPIAPKSEGLTNIEKSVAYLDDFSPQGPGNIENAILQAINNLAGRKDVQEIIVITSGLDETCEPLNRNILDIAAGVKDVKYSIIILAVGEQSEATTQKLSHFAHKYREVPLAQDIPSSVETIVGEPIFSYYSR